ncbi:hypothetical protein ACLBSY_25325 [Pseudomonas aeruginosa]|uniref:hypothetical protein n=1 Tax=Pseudomonas aeruginosa TaxID=287 RepID=UPI0038C3DEAD
MSEVKRFDHVNHAHIDDCEHVESSEGAWVTASDYDALAAKLAMAEDAAAKGDAARQQCGGMEMEIEELRAEAKALREEVAKLTQYNKSLDEENTRLLADCEKTDREVAALRARVAVVPDRLPRSSDIAAIHQHSIGWNACLDELARINGMTVSEGLLRRIVTPALTSSDAQDRIGALEELRALLSE